MSVDTDEIEAWLRSEERCVVSPTPRIYQALGYVRLLLDERTAIDQDDNATLQETMAENRRLRARLGAVRKLAEKWGAEGEGFDPLNIGAYIHIRQAERELLEALEEGA